MKVWRRSWQRRKHLFFAGENVLISFHIVIPNVRNPTLGFQSNPFPEVDFGGPEGASALGCLAKAKGKL
jgi:hypothetical protein